MLTTLTTTELAAATGGGLMDPFAVLLIPMYLQSWVDSRSPAPPPAPTPRRTPGKPLDIRPQSQRQR